MSKDNFWNDGTTTQRRHEGVSDAMNAAARREDLARAEAKARAEAEKRQLEQARQEPKEALCKKCGKVSFSPCEP
jgi:hypothetical protein